MRMFSTESLVPQEILNNPQPTSTDSGWNCKPNIGILLCLTPIPGYSKQIPQTSYCFQEEGRSERWTVGWRRGGRIGTNSAPLLGSLGLARRSCSGVLMHGCRGDSAAPEKNIQKVIILWCYAQNKAKRKAVRYLF